MENSIIKTVTWELLTYPLPIVVGGSGVSVVDLIVCTLETSGGHSGLGFSYAIGGGAEASLAAGQRLTDALLRGRPLAHPEAVWAKAQALCGRTGKGPNFVGYAAADVALWDLYAKVHDLPLGEAMGGAPRAVPVYGSGGYRPAMTAESVATQVDCHLAQGFRAIKVRLAGDHRDEIVLKAAASALGGAGQMMADLNEKGSLSLARRTLDSVSAYGGLFVEEPLPAHDFQGYRQLAQSHAGRIATGEHLQGLSEAGAFLLNGLCAVIQPDLAMIGGLSEALRVARLAEAVGCEVMPHFLPGLFVHLAAACPAVTWLEDFPLLEPLLSGWPETAADGTLRPGEALGHGLTIDAEARARFLRR